MDRYREREQERKKQQERERGDGADRMIDRKERLKQRNDEIWRERVRDSDRVLF